MKKFYVTNYTMNSNIAIYLGAYTNIIHKIAILNSNSEFLILKIIPYLEQLKITYKIYSDEIIFRKDIGSFQPEALLSMSNDHSSCTMLNEFASTLEIDVIYANPKEPLSSKLLQGNWYTVVIFNPKTNETTYIYHTNFRKNIPFLMMLDNYQTIEVE